MTTLLEVKEHIEHFVNTLGRAPENLTVLMTEIAFEKIKIQLHKVSGAEIRPKGLVLFGAEVIVIRPPRTEAPVSMFSVTEVMK